MRFATAYTSDISVFGEGLINLLGSLMLGGMGVRYFSEVGVDAKHLFAMALRRVLTSLISSWHWSSY